MEWFGKHTDYGKTKDCKLTPEPRVEWNSRAGCKVCSTRKIEVGIDGLGCQGFTTRGSKTGMLTQFYSR